MRDFALHLIDHAAGTLAHAAREAGWPWTENLKHLERLTLELADAIRSTPAAADAPRPNARPAHPAGRGAAPEARPSNGLDARPGGHGRRPAGRVHGLGDDAFNGRAHPDRVRPARARAPRPATGGEVRQRLGELPGLEVRFGLGAARIACPHCGTSWDDTDLGLDEMTIESLDDIDHIVPWGREDEHIGIVLKPR